MSDLKRARKASSFYRRVPKYKNLDLVKENIKNTISDVGRPIGMKEQQTKKEMKKTGSSQNENMKSRSVTCVRADCSSLSQQSLREVNYNLTTTTGSTAFTYSFKQAPSSSATRKLQFVNVGTTSHPEEFGQAVTASETVNIEGLLEYINMKFVQIVQMQEQTKAMLEDLLKASNLSEGQFYGPTFEHTPKKR